MRIVPKALVERSKLVSEWSKAVRERDGKCVKCGREDGLGAARIDRDGAFDLANGVTLCVTCKGKHYPRKVRLDRERPQRKTLLARIAELEAALREVSGRRLFIE